MRSLGTSLFDWLKSPFHLLLLSNNRLLHTVRIIDFDWHFFKEKVSLFRTVIRRGDRFPPCFGFGRAGLNPSPKSHRRVHRCGRTAFSVPQRAYIKPGDFLPQGHVGCAPTIAVPFLGLFDNYQIFLEKKHKGAGQGQALPPPSTVEKDGPDPLSSRGGRNFYRSHFFIKRLHGIMKGR